jgi:hypothetical protein
LLRSNAVIISVGAAGAALRVLLARHGYVHNTFINGVIVNELPLFLCGALAARFYCHWLLSGRLADTLCAYIPAYLVAPALKTAGAGALCGLLFYYLEGWELFPSGGGWYTGLFKLPHAWWAVLVATAFCLPWVMLTFGKPGWDRFLGELSYPVYITHLLIRECLRKYPLVPDAQICVYVLGGSIAISCVLVFVIERPLDSLRHRLFLDGKTRSGQDRGRKRAALRVLQMQDHRFLPQIISYGLFLPSGAYAVQVVHSRLRMTGGAEDSALIISSGRLARWRYMPHDRRGLPA